MYSFHNKKSVGTMLVLKLLKVNRKALLKLMMQKGVPQFTEGMGSHTFARQKYLRLDSFSQ